MITKLQIKQEIEESQALGAITQVFAEIASVRMQKVRGSVLTNRQFLSSVYQVFQEVLYSYNLEIKRILKDKSEITFLAHNGRTVVVLLSVNSSLYGDAVSEAFNKFLGEIRDKDVEITILGRYGLNLYKQAYPNRPYTYFEFAEEGIDPVLMSDVLRHLVQYEEIRIVYPFFKSLAAQTPEVFIVNAASLLREEPRANHNKYLFEPGVLGVMQFFESEIFASIFEQSVRESQLAKYASRMLAMDRASQKVSEHLSKLNLTRLKTSHLASNRSQLQSLPTIMRFSQII